MQQQKERERSLLCKSDIVIEKIAISRIDVILCNFKQDSGISKHSSVGTTHSSFPRNL